MANIPTDFSAGDILTIEHPDYFGRRFVVTSMEFDSSLLEYYCCIKEVGSNWEKNNIGYNSLRYMVCNAKRTKLGKLLYG